MSGKNVTEVVPADAEGIAKAARILTRGGLVAVPTETVYGLAARADSAEAVAKIYAAKGRPDFNPLIVHVGDEAQANDIAELSAEARRVISQLWPGPLTLVLPARPDALLAKAVTAGLKTVAIRASAHPIMLNLLGSVDFPLAAPSANRSGFISPTRAEHVLESLDGKVDLILDAGPTQTGVESTILAIRDGGKWQELRPGPIDLRALHLEHFGAPLAENLAIQSIEAPGQLASHYAPGKPVRLNAKSAEAGEFMIGFCSVEGECNLSRAGDLVEAAAWLYDCLYKGAASSKSKIAVAPIPDDGVGRAINDRLRRAAAD